MPLRANAGWTLLLACTGACAQPPARVSLPPRAGTAEPALATSSAPASPASAPTPSATVVAPPPAAAPPFPPARVTPPFARSAQAGDGEWQRFDDGSGEALLYSTVIHPHESSRFISLVIVVADLTRLRLDFLPGVDDVGKTAVPFAPGLVPEGEQAELLAAFNGGFMPRHGRWGMRVGDVTLLPPRDAGCTIALAEGGGVYIRSWPALATATDLRVVRQTPPCLLEQGEVNAELLAGRDKVWAGHTAGLVTRRRSALGLSQDGQRLFYAIGVEASPKQLANGLLAAGAHDAAQLDINWNWTRFLLFGRDANGKPNVTKTLAPVEHTKRDYVGVASKRDFFYLRRTATPR